MIEQEVRDFKQRLIDEGKSGLGFDLDETVVDTAKYWMKQLQELFGNPEGTTPEQMITKYKYTQHVPYWQTHEALAWMDAAREDNELYKTLPLIEGASHVVNQINKIVPVVGYVSVRSRVVAQGTEEWLRTYDFPQVDLLLRPTDVPHHQGTQWKAETLHFLFPQVIGIVDDNRSLAEHLGPHYPGRVFLFDSIEGIEGRTNIIPCPTWNDVYAQVQLFYAQN
ncbi:MAG TPA: hypothetical protein VJC10_02055 [Patescibacteria group bacterium]|nr:hypothetical protein [Patescibacteria group bacterium]